MSVKIDRDLCPKCETVKWIVDLQDDKGRSIGEEWTTCKKCGSRFLRPTKDEKLIPIIK